nr:MAG TPA: hypothetical protein [Herelleviridae sp.]
MIHEPNGVMICSNARGLYTAFIWFNRDRVNAVSLDT